MTTFLLVCLGGAVGTGLRYGVVCASVALLGTIWPLGTLLVNIIGSFALAALSEWGLTAVSMTPALRLAVSMGVLGGFTTYSSFNQEVLQAFVAGAWARGVGYLLLTTTSCLAAGVGGMWLMRR